MTRFRQVGSVAMALVIAACGGGGSGGGAGGGGTGPDTTPPLVALTAPTQATFLLAGDPLPLEFSVDDQQEAAVRVVLDPDHDPLTEPGQVLLYADTDHNGQPVSLTASTTAVPPGTYSLYVIADDGIHPPEVSPPTFVVVAKGVAGVSPNRRNRYAVVGRYVAFTRGEAEDGNVVLNADGAADDGVVALFDVVTGQVITTHATADVTGPLPLPAAQAFATYGSDVAWHRREADEGGDMNADGDALDTYVAWLRLPSDTTVHMLATAGATLVPTPAGAPTIVSLVEAAGGVDLNGDLDTFDTLFARLDRSLATATVFPLPPRVGSPFLVAPGGARGAYLIDEFTQGPFNVGLDFTLDLDTADTLLRFESLYGGPGGFGGAVPGVGQPPRTLDPTAAFAISDSSWVGYVVDEGLSSATPINGDADITDRVAALYDTAPSLEAVPGTGLQAGLGARFFFFALMRALYPVIDEGASDRNGDGDLLDLETLYWTDVMNPGTATRVAPGVGTLAGLALDGGLIAPVEDAPGWFSLVAVETANSTDLNGDGDTGDRVLALLDTTTPVPTLHWTGLTPLPLGTPQGATIPETGVGGPEGLLVQVAESVNGDLNEDGDVQDVVLVFLPFANPAAPVVFGDTGALHAALHGDRIAVTVREALAGKDLDGDGDAQDVVFRLLRTDGSVLEAGRRCDAASLPVTSTGRVWAYLRSEAAEFRDLNGDGDATDLVLGVWLDELPAPPGP